MNHLSEEGSQCGRKNTTALNKITPLYFGNAPETPQIIRSQDKHDGNKET